MNFPITFLITVGISIATLFVGSGVIDRLSARKHWIKQIEECQTAISATDDERIHTALRRKSHHFSKAVTRDKCVPTSPLATFNMALGFIGLLLLAVIQFPPLHLPGWVDLLALVSSLASALLFLRGITTYLNGLVEQDVYEELGYPENFQRLRTHLCATNYRFAVSPPQHSPTPRNNAYETSMPPSPPAPTKTKPAWHKDRGCPKVRHPCRSSPREV